MFGLFISICIQMLTDAFQRSTLSITGPAIKQSLQQFSFLDWLVKVLFHFSLHGLRGIRTGLWLHHFSYKWDKQDFIVEGEADKHFMTGLNYNDLCMHFVSEWLIYLQIKHFLVLFNNYSNTIGFSFIVSDCNTAFIQDKQEMC